MNRVIVIYTKFTAGVSDYKTICFISFEKVKFACIARKTVPQYFYAFGIFFGNTADRSRDRSGKNKTFRTILSKEFRSRIV